MKRLDPIHAYKRFANGFFYALSTNLDLQESAQVRGNETDRMRFFQTHWPDLYTWLLLNSNEDNWSLYDRGIYPDVSFIMAIYFDDVLYFNSAFSDLIEFVDSL
jgi:hypothetical protein